MYLPGNFVRIRVAISSIMRANAIKSNTHVKRYLCSQRRTVKTAIRLQPNSSHVDDRNAPKDFHSDSAIVYDNIISQEEGEHLLKDIIARMKRRRYETSHWDSVITGYREVELYHPYDMEVVQNIRDNDGNSPDGSNSELSEHSIKIISFIRDILQKQFFPNNESSLRWLPCHAIDLKKSGVLSAHVDSVKFSGDIVAGLSLQSSSIMRLKPEKDMYDDKEEASSFEGHVDLLLPPLSLYVLSGVSRYQYSHELLPSGSLFSSSSLEESVEVVRDQRFSIIFRDAKYE